jgi:hypothetical protein
MLLLFLSLRCAARRPAAQGIVLSNFRDGTTEVIPCYVWMVRKESGCADGLLLLLLSLRYAAASNYVASLCCCSFCRSAAPSAALRVSACGLKLENATTSTPACAKAAHAGDPGACGSKELFFIIFRDGTTEGHTLLRANGPQESGCADIKNRLTRCGLKRPWEQNAYRRITPDR